MRVDGKGESKRSPLSFKRRLVPDFFPNNRSMLSHFLPQLFFFFSKISHRDTPTLPTPTLLTLTCTQVLWFLARPTRPCASFCANNRLSYMFYPRNYTQCIRDVYLPQFLDFSLSFLYVFSLPLTLLLPINKHDNETLVHTVRMEKIWLVHVLDCP